MPRNQDRERANLGEQTDMERTDIERQDRSMEAGAHGDSRSGAEGIEDPALEQSSSEELDRHEDGDGMAAKTGRGRSEPGEFSRATRRTRHQSEKVSEDESFSGQGRQKEGSRSDEGTGYVK